MINFILIVVVVVYWWFADAVADAIGFGDQVAGDSYWLLSPLLYVCMASVGWWWSLGKMLAEACF